MPIVIGEVVIWNEVNAIAETARTNPRQPHHRPVAGRLPRMPRPLREQRAAA
ncbi:MAG TPA: hypothetical protein VLA16_14990 [Ideonella sp.]|nr:hypothetical protein [Ideonella sp.]